MSVEERRLQSGEEITDFIIDDGMGSGFLATLSGTELNVGWNGSPGTLIFRLAQVQQRAGGPGSIASIVGYASEGLEELIETERFDAPVWERLLSARLGGTWRVEVTHGRRIWVRFTRTGG